MSGITRPATAADVSWVAPAAARAHLVADPAELVAVSQAEPWRVRVTERGEAVLMGRWREHTADLAVLGLWCAPARVPFLVGDLIEVARAQGFDRLLGPLVPESQAGPYLDAGLRVVERVAVLRLERPGRVTAAAPPAGVTLRQATADDLDAIARVDRASFPDFWRYDPAQIARLLDTGRGALAEEAGRAIGYTLATVSGGEGSLGRLAVAPGGRHRGVGAALASEAVVWLAGQGVRAVTLSTQSDNEPSRRLYGRLGFRRLPDTLVACASGPLAAPH
jgi:ribosomal protein S18 acetylase RimI-like enzyme